MTTDTSATPETDALADSLSLKCSCGELSYYEMRMHARRMERERNKLLKQITTERFIADRLAEIMQRGIEVMGKSDIPFIQDAKPAIDVWKEVRSE